MKSTPFYFLEYPNLNLGRRETKYLTEYASSDVKTHTSRTKGEQRTHKKPLTETITQMSDKFTYGKAQIFRNACGKI